MQIDAQLLQINARCLNVPCVFYSVGNSSKFLKFQYVSSIHSDLILRMFKMGVGTLLESSLIPQRH